MTDKAKIAPFTVPAEHKEFLEREAEMQGQTITAVLRVMIANKYNRRKRGLK